MRTLLFIIIIYSLAGSCVIAQTPLKERDTTIKGSQTFALIVGVSKYKYIQPLQFADKDAELFRDYIKSPAGGFVKDDNIFFLINEQVDIGNFWAKGFQWLRSKKLQKGDRLFIYLAGHGDAIDQDQFFFLGYDCNPAGDKNNYLVGGAIQLFNLKKKIAAETSKGVDVFFIMDACRTNELPGGTAGLNFLNTAVTEKKAGETIMLATAAGYESLEDASIGEGHGLFTWYLVEGLKGIADSINVKDSRITLQEIQTYVTANVSQVAMQRFKKNQVPFFCCDDKSGQVITHVDSIYLMNWLRLNKSKGSGNSIGNFSSVKNDTAGLYLYTRFNQAISQKNSVGRANAESLFNQLQQRYSGNIYTLDAKSTLAAEFIRQAQASVSSYLINGSIDPVKIREYNEASEMLEKAIVLLKEDDPDFTQSIMSRFYFLRSAGEYSVIEAFQNAYAVLFYENNSAIAANLLSALHLSVNNEDSALYYARRAVSSAPHWKPAYTSLSKVFSSKGMSDSAKYYKKRAESDDPTATGNASPGENDKSKFKTGFKLGTGSSLLKPTYSSRGTTTITGVSGTSSIRLDLGLTGHLQLGNSISLRPETGLLFNGPTLEFLKRNQTGGTDVEKLKIEYISYHISLPLVVNMSRGKTSPYFSIAPFYEFIFGTVKETDLVLPLKKSLFSANMAMGVDFEFSKGGVVFSPQIGYSAGLNNIKGNTSTEYAAAISSLKSNAFNLTFYMRKK